MTVLCEAFITSAASFNAQTTEVAQFDHLCLPGSDSRESLQSVVQGKNGSDQ
jgi:hypothetical protein